MTSNWKFDDNITPIFDEHVRQHVPMYDDLHNTIAGLAGWFLEDDTNVYDIGTSTGKVIDSILEKYKDKLINIVGVDTSRDMIDKSKRIFSGNSNVKLICGDATDDSFEMKNASLVTAILTTQFIPQRYRQTLVDKIYNSLNPGGGFILVEKIIGNNARFNEMWVEMYHEMKLRNGVSEAQVFQKSKAIRGVLRPLTVDENMKLLYNAGFKDVDMFFKWNNFAGLIAIK